jgi:hypothetical protein
MTFKQLVMKKLESIRCLKRYIIRRAVRKSETGFDIVKKASATGVKPINIKKKRITDKSQYIKKHSVKSGLKLGRA